MSAPRLLTLADAAPILGISRAGVYRLAKKNALPGLRRLSPRQFRVSTAELEAFLGAPIERTQPEAA